MGNGDLYNSYKTFSNNEFGEIRTLEVNNTAWLVGKDVASVLQYNEPSKAVVRHVDEDDRIKHPITDSTGRDQESWIINESGLYSLILSSKMENAKKFKKWVTSEVLPSIRKHGAYMTDDTIEKALTSPDFLIQLATKLKEEQEKSKELEDKLEKNSKMLNQIAISKNSLLVREVAKVISNQHSIKIGEKKLYQKLRDWGWVLQNSTEAKQEALRRGYLEVREGVLENTKGTYVYHTTRVTGKGQRKILEKLLEELEEKEGVTNE
ncbi:hypothetical protein TPDSL_23320 [Terrisporobacter petrolearius]|uniref:BRO family protein n=1 Tax=Terrisporobacter petrolearius TaxID=1460447 RepID=UPI0033698003